MHLLFSMKQECSPCSLLVQFVFLNCWSGNPESISINTIKSFNLERIEQIEKRKSLKSVTVFVWAGQQQFISNKYITLMIGQALTITAIIVSIYFIVTSLLSLGNSDSTEDSPNSYCYEGQNPINHTTQMRSYLHNITTSLAPSSPSAVLKKQQQISQPLVRTEGANAIALEFKKYIIAYENIKSRNEYEQTFNKGIRQARDNFFQCREQFLSNEWDCNGTYSRYLQSGQEFLGIKGQITELMDQKFYTQKKLEALLEPPSSDPQTDNEAYSKLIEVLQNQLTAALQALKEKNDTLTGLENKELRIARDLSSIEGQLTDCRKNKNEIEVCKNISERIQGIFFSVDPRDLQIRITAKQGIIKRYQNALAKSKKVGLDTTDIKIKIEKNKRELQELMDMFNEVQTASLCAGDLIKKCSDQHIKELEVNVTSLQQELVVIVQLKSAIKETISKGKLLVDSINEKKRKIDEQYQNSLDSLEKIQELQAQNLKKLQLYKENITKINQMIIDMQPNVNQAELTRQQVIKDMNIIMSRVGNLTDCLSKKDYLNKLQSKRPQHTEQSERERRKAADELVAVIGKAYK